MPTYYYFLSTRASVCKFVCLIQYVFLFLFCQLLRFYGRFVLFFFLFVHVLAGEVAGLSKIMLSRSNTDGFYYETFTGTGVLSFYRPSRLMKISLIIFSSDAALWTCLSPWRHLGPLYSYIMALYIKALYNWYLG